MVNQSDIDAALTSLSAAGVSSETSEEDALSLLSTVPDIDTAILETLRSEATAAAIAVATAEAAEIDAIATESAAAVLEIDAATTKKAAITLATEANFLDNEATAAAKLLSPPPSPSPSPSPPQSFPASPTVIVDGFADLLPSPPSPPPAEDKDDVGLYIIIGATLLGGAVFLAVIAGFCFRRYNQRRQYKKHLQHDNSAYETGYHNDEEARYLPPPPVAQWRHAVQDPTNVSPPPPMHQETLPTWSSPFTPDTRGRVKARPRQINKMK
jgi:hypothetical protein